MFSMCPSQCSLVVKSGIGEANSLEMRNGIGSNTERSVGAPYNRTAQLALGAQTMTNVSKVKLGKKVRMSNGPDGQHHYLTVGPACENKTNGNWYCCTHREMPRNQCTKDSHIDGPGKHELAWLCFEHGLEVP